MFLSRGLMRFQYINSTTGSLRLYRRSSLRKLTKIQNEEMLKKLVCNPQIESTEDVTRLKSTVLSTLEAFSPENIDRSLLIHFTNNKQYNIALNYIRFIEEETRTKLHLFLTNQQFLIYFHKRYNEGRLSINEQELIIQLYQNLKQRSSVLDCASLENAILALSVTSNWKECLTLFEDLKRLGSPSGVCYSAMIAGAFLNAEEETAWTLLDEMFAEQKQANDVIFRAYFEKLGELSGKKDILLKLDKLLQACSENNYILTENTILELCELLDNSGFTYKQLSVNNKGFCENCNEKLNLMELSENVFDNLRKKIFEGVIVGKNIFSKTTPVELSKFQEFLKTLTNCNVVIDGLNVAYIAGTKQTTQVFSTLLAQVVAHFVERNQKVVVLGRKHMESWPKKQWNYIKSNARLFLTQDISQDDPYLLYCALHCGKDAIMVSRDLMRSHLFLLKDPKDKIMFSRWLEQRQFQLSHIRNDGRVFFKFPRPYTRIVQHNNKNLHIPFNVAEDKTEEINNVPDKWLCIRKP